MHVVVSSQQHLGSNAGILGFEIRNRLRKLTVEGDPAYDLSVHCETCSFLFTRVGVPRPGVLPASLLAERLRTILEVPDTDIVKAYSALLPEDDYVVALLDARPMLAMPGTELDYFSRDSVSLFGLEPPFYDLPPSPATPYYLTEASDLEPRDRLWGYGQPDGPYQMRVRAFGFLAPMVSIRALDPSTVDSYRGRSKGTAVALSVLDAKAPSVPLDGSDPISKEATHGHWCWTHFLLDGHHKVRAASLDGGPVRILSFTALSAGVSTPETVGELVAHLSRRGN